MTPDDRMTGDLIIDVLRVLERHGYHGYDHEHTGQAICMIDDLARVYEGTRDGPYATHVNPATPSPPAGSGRPAAEADQDAVLLSHAEASTAAVALTEASDHNRDRAAACADCADQSCGTCQWRLQAAGAYDRLAVQMLQAAQASRTADPQPEPGNLGTRPGQADPGADKEAGQ